VRDTQVCDMNYSARSRYSGQNCNIFQLCVWGSSIFGTKDNLLRPVDHWSLQRQWELFLISCRPTCEHSCIFAWEVARARHCCACYVLVRRKKIEILGVFKNFS